MGDAPLGLEVTRQPGLEDYEQVIELRRDRFYPNPRDERYWQGGVHQILSVAELQSTQSRDPGSFYVLARDSQRRLAAYARLSASTGGSGKLHIIMARRDLPGRKIGWQFPPHGEVFHGTPGRILCGIAIGICEEAGCTNLVSDIYIAPVPNLPSLALHHALKFLPSAVEPETMQRHDPAGILTEVRFLRMYRSLVVS